MIKTSIDRKMAKLSGVRNGTRPIQGQGKAQRSSTRCERKSSNNLNTLFPARAAEESVAWHEGCSVLDLKSENYFSCAVGRKRSNARYQLNSTDDVVRFLKYLAGTHE